MMLHLKGRRGVGAAVVLALTSLAAQAQQSPATIRLLPEDAQRGFNGHQHNFYFLPPGQTGENYQNAGFWGQKLRPYLAGNAEALGRLGDYRRHKNFFLLDRVVAVGALGVYGGLVFEKDKFPQYASTPQLVAGGVFVGSILATLFINRNTNSHFKHAVEAHNVGKSGTWVPGQLRPSTWGVRANAGPGGGPTLALGWRW